MSFSPSLTINIDPTGTGNFSGVVQDSTGQWFVMRVDLGASAEDVQIDRHSSGGTYKDSCLLLGAGHQTGFGVLDGQVWCSVGDDVVRFPYVKGTIDPATIEVVDYFGGGHESQISFSPTRTNCVVRERFTHSNGVPVSRFVKRSVADILAGVDKVNGAIELPRAATDPTRVEQSFGLSGSQLFVGYGEANTLAWLEQWDFTTGLQVGGKYDVSKLGADKVSEDWWEIEFAEGEHILLKRGTGSRRRLLVYKHNLDS